MRNKELYLESGYLDFNAVVDPDCPFAFVVGGRATGKSFGALKWCKEHFDETGHPFIYMRRTKAQAELVATNIFNPYRPLNDLYGWNIEPFQVSKGVYGFYDSITDQDGRKTPVGNYIGIIASLTTFSNFRGFDGSNIDTIVYDEFIKNKGEKAIRDEGFSLMNVFETVNRNREIIGGDPVKLICLSNSNALGNDIFVDLGLVNAVEFMKKKHRNQYYDYGRGIAIYDLSDSKISALKKNTALYKLDAGGEYSAMALGNEFEDYDRTNIKAVPIQEYKPLVVCGELCFYQHKSEHLYYCTTHISGSPARYGATAVEVTRFTRKYWHLWEAYLSERVFFESFICKSIFEKIFL